jgi:cytochrome c oxidase subunit 2
MLSETGQPALLAVDNEVVAARPAKYVQIQVVGADVIHNFAMPSFGVRIDAIPGRLNNTWFTTEREGTVTASARDCAAATTRLHADRDPHCRVRRPMRHGCAEAKQKFAALDAPAVRGRAIPATSER